MFAVASLRPLWWVMLRWPRLLIGLAIAALAVAPLTATARWSTVAPVAQGTPGSAVSWLVADLSLAVGVPSGAAETRADGIAGVGSAEGAVGVGSAEGTRPESAGTSAGAESAQPVRLARPSPTQHTGADDTADIDAGHGRYDAARAPPDR